MYLLRFACGKWDFIYCKQWPRQTWFLPTQISQPARERTRLKLMGCKLDYQSLGLSHFQQPWAQSLSLRASTLSSVKWAWETHVCYRATARGKEIDYPHKTFHKDVSIQRVLSKCQPWWLPSSWLPLWLRVRMARCCPAHWMKPYFLWTWSMLWILPLSYTSPLFITSQGSTNPLLLAIYVVPIDHLLFSPEISPSNPFWKFK